MVSEAGETPLEPINDVGRCLQTRSNQSITNTTSVDSSLMKLLTTSYNKTIPTWYPYRPSTTSATSPSSSNHAAAGGEPTRWRIPVLLSVLIPFSIATALFIIIRIRRRRPAGAPVVEADSVEVGRTPQPATSDIPVPEQETQEIAWSSHFSPPCAELDAGENRSTSSSTGSVAVTPTEFYPLVSPPLVSPASDTTDDCRPGSVSPLAGTDVRLV